MAKEKKQSSRRPQREERAYEQRMVDIARVTRVMAGGKRMSFRACVVIGDQKGRVAYGVAKGSDVQQAMNKSIQQAEKRWLTVPLTKNGTIPHELTVKFKSALVLLKPARAGTGVKAGGAVRAVFELAGIQNIVAKQLGSSNKMNNIKAAYKALGMLREFSDK